MATKGEDGTVHVSGENSELDSNMNLEEERTQELVVNAETSLDTGQERIIDGPSENNLDTESVNSKDMESEIVIEAESTNVTDTESSNDDENIDNNEVSKRLDTENSTHSIVDTEDQGVTVDETQLNSETESPKADTESTMSDSFDTESTTVNMSESVDEGVSVDPFEFPKGPESSETEIRNWSINPLHADSEEDNKTSEDRSDKSFGDLDDVDGVNEEEEEEEKEEMEDLNKDLTEEPKEPKKIQEEVTDLDHIQERKDDTQMHENEMPNKNEDLENAQHLTVDDDTMVESQPSLNVDEDHHKIDEDHHQHEISSDFLNNPGDTETSSDSSLHSEEVQDEDISGPDDRDVDEPGAKASCLDNHGSSDTDDKDLDMNEYVIISNSDDDDNHSGQDAKSENLDDVEICDKSDIDEQEQNIVTLDGAMDDSDTGLPNPIEPFPCIYDSGYDSANIVGSVQLHNGLEHKVTEEATKGECECNQDNHELVLDTQVGDLTEQTPTENDDIDLKPEMDNVDVMEDGDDQNSDNVGDDTLTEESISDTHSEGKNEGDALEDTMVETSESEPSLNGDVHPETEPSDDRNNDVLEATEPSDDRDMEVPEASASSSKAESEENHAAAMFENAAGDTSSIVISEAADETADENQISMLSSKSSDDVDISTEPVQKTMNTNLLDAYKKEPNVSTHGAGRNNVSLFNELVHAQIRTGTAQETKASGSEDDTSDNGQKIVDRSASNPEEDVSDLTESDIENIDDASSMVNKHKKLVATTKKKDKKSATASSQGALDEVHSHLEAIPIVSPRSSSIKNEDENFLMYSNNSLFSSANEHPLKLSLGQTMDKHGMDLVVSNVIGETVKENMGTSSSSGASFMKSLDDDEVSDVMSVMSEPRSSATASNVSDELLHILEMIGATGYGMRTELDHARTRETILHRIKQQETEANTAVITDLTNDLEALQQENQRLQGELVTYKSKSRNNSLKVKNMEKLVDKLNGHIEELEIGLAEERVKRQQRLSERRNVGTITDDVATNNSWVQTEEEGHYINEVMFPDELCRSQPQRSSTPSNPHRARLVTSSLPSSPSAIRGRVELETDEPPPKIPSRATAMLDKILMQMNNLAASCDASFNNSQNSSDTILEDMIEDSEPETPEKWRRLAMTPVNSDPTYLGLQRSLATAAFENELLQAKVKKGEKAQNRKIENLNKELEEYKRLLRRSEEEQEVLRVKHEGDNAEMDLMMDKIASLEKALTMSQAHNTKLSGLLDSSQGQSSLRAESSAQTEATGAHQANGQGEKLSSNEPSESNQDREAASGGSLETDVVLNEVRVLREEYMYLQKCMGLVENVLNSETAPTETLLQPGTLDYSAPAESNDGVVINAQDNQSATTSRHINQDNMAFPIHQKQIDELKRHVFGWKQYQTLKAQPAVAPQGEFSVQQQSSNPVHQGSFATVPVGSSHGHFVTVPKEVSQMSPSSPIISVSNGLSLQRTSVIPTSVQNVTQSQQLNSTLPSSSGGYTLHDDIMKQSEMVLNTLHEAGELKEDKVPSTLFHWQDVRNSIASELLNETQQKIEGVPSIEESKAAFGSQVESSSKEPQDEEQASSSGSGDRSSQDERLVKLLESVHNHLSQKEGKVNDTPKYDQNKGEIQAVKSSSKDKLSQNLVQLLENVQQELGAEVDVVITSKDSPGDVIKLKPKEKSKSPAVEDDMPLISTEELAQRKKVYMKEYKKINAEFEDLRKKRLAHLVQAYTGKTDPCLSKNEDKEQKEKDEQIKSASPQDASDLVQTILNRSLPLDPSTLDSAPAKSLHHSQSFSEFSNAKANQAIPNNLPPDISETISAISADSLLIKEKIQKMRDQISKAESSRTRRPRVQIDDWEDEEYKNEEDDFVDDEFEGDESNPYRSPTKPLRRSDGKQVTPKTINRASLLMEQRRRQIYPHKKGYEKSDDFYKRQQENLDDSQAQSVDDYDVNESGHDHSYNDNRLTPNQYRNETWSTVKESVRLAENAQRQQSEWEEVSRSEGKSSSRKPERDVKPLNYSKRHSPDQLTDRSFDKLPPENLSSHQNSSSRDQIFVRPNPDRSDHQKSFSRDRSLERPSPDASRHQRSLTRDRSLERPSPDPSGHQKSFSRDQSFERPSPDTSRHQRSFSRERSLERPSPDDSDHQTSFSRERSLERPSPNDSRLSQSSLQNKSCSDVRSETEMIRTNYERSRKDRHSANVDSMNLSTSSMNETMSDLDRSLDVSGKRSTKSNLLLDKQDFAKRAEIVKKMRQKEEEELNMYYNKAINEIRKIYAAEGKAAGSKQATASDSVSVTSKIDRSSDEPRLYPESRGTDHDHSDVLMSKSSPETPQSYPQTYSSPVSTPSKKLGTIELLNGYSSKPVPSETMNHDRQDNTTSKDTKSYATTGTIELLNTYGSKSVPSDYFKQDTHRDIIRNDSKSYDRSYDYLRNESPIVDKTKTYPGKETSKKPYFDKDIFSYDMKPEARKRDIKQFEPSSLKSTSESILRKIESDVSAFPVSKVSSRFDVTKSFDSSYHDDKPELDSSINDSRNRSLYDEEPVRGRSTTPTKLQANNPKVGLDTSYTGEPYSLTPTKLPADACNTVTTTKKQSIIELLNGPIQRSNNSDELVKPTSRESSLVERKMIEKALSDRHDVPKIVPETPDHIAPCKDDDTASESASDADFVVTKAFDIVKRPRSPSPKPKQKLKVSASPNSSFVRSPSPAAYEENSQYRRVMDDSTSRYCEAMRDTAYRPSTNRTDDGILWSEPKRYFGPRVQWAADNTDLMDQSHASEMSAKSYPNGILKSSDSQKDEHTGDPTPNGNESKPSAATITTDEPTRNASHVKDDGTPTRNITALNNDTKVLPTREDSKPPTTRDDTSTIPFLSAEQQKRANDIISRYTTAPPNDDSEPNNPQITEKQKKLIDDILTKYTAEWQERDDGGRIVTVESDRSQDKNCGYIEECDMTTVNGNTNGNSQSKQISS